MLNLILVKLCNRGEDCIMMIGPMKKKVVTSAVVTGIILILVFVANKIGVLMVVFILLIQIIRLQNCKRKVKLFKDMYLRKIWL